jgi:hypothetical protein
LRDLGGAEGVERSLFAGDCGGRLHHEDLG